MLRFLLLLLLLLFTNFESLDCCQCIILHCTRHGARIISKVVALLPGKQKNLCGRDLYVANKVKTRRERRLLRDINYWLNESASRFKNEKKSLFNPE